MFKHEEKLFKKYVIKEVRGKDFLAIKGREWHFNENRIPFKEVVDSKFQGENIKVNNMEGKYNRNDQCKTKYYLIDRNFNILYESENDFVSSDEYVYEIGTKMFTNLKNGEKKNSTFTKILLFSTKILYKKYYISYDDEYLQIYDIENNNDKTFRCRVKNLPIENDLIYIFNENYLNIFNLKTQVMEQTEKSPYSSLIYNGKKIKYLNKTLYLEKRIIKKINLNLYPLSNRNVHKNILTYFLANKIHYFYLDYAEKQIIFNILFLNLQYDIFLIIKEYLLS